MNDGSILSIQQLSENVTQLFMPVLATMMVIFVGMMIKDLITKFSNGMMLRLNPAYREGEFVFIDGESAIIVKIGMFTSVFGITKEDGTYCWRYVPNTRLENLKIEKVIKFKGKKEDA